MEKGNNFEITTEQRHLFQEQRVRGNKGIYFRNKDLAFKGTGGGWGDKCVYFRNKDLAFKGTKA